ncbi:MAG: autotransporter domain-containing protein [Pikeienuella sp.]
MGRARLACLNTLAARTLFIAGAGGPALAADVDIDGGASVSAPIATEAGDRLRVGVDGEGRLAISDGAVVESNTGYIGRNAGSYGVITIGETGAGSRWSNGAGIYVGFEGIGVLNIGAGAATADEIYLGHLPGSSGTIDMNGSAASLTVADFIEVGDHSTGSLNISNGAVVQSARGWLGDEEDGRGFVYIDGAGSIWRTGFFNPGAEGAGTVAVTGGGRLESSYSWSAIRSASSADITISGDGSEWALSDYLLLGANGSAKLLVENGGKITSGVGYIGYDLDNARPGSDKPLHGQVTIRGAGAGWTSSSDIFVGHSLNGELWILDGGVVNSAGGAIAFNQFAGGATSPSTNGTVLVHGENSRWNIGANGLGMSIFTDSNANLTIAGGGQVASGGEVTVTQGAGTKARINIGAAAGEGAVAPGILSAPSIRFYDGDGGILFNHTAADHVFDAALNGGADNAAGSNTGLIGDGAVEAVAGRTIFNAGHGDFAGRLEAREAGILQINGDMSGAGVSVLTGGRLEGNGAVGAVISRGAIAPGVKDAAGKLTIGGDLTLESGSVMDFGLGGPSGTAGVDSDLIEVRGDLTLDGAINIANTGGFGPGLYRLVNYGGGLTDNGLDIGVTPAGFAATGLTLQTSVASQVNLLVAGPAAGSFSFWDGPNKTANAAVDGGAGVWTATGANWTTADGGANGAFDPAALLIFAGKPGAVTVDDSAGAVAIRKGMQFFTDGYTVGGDSIELDGATVVHVGDGTAAGAGFTATISSALTGAGSLEKTNSGALILAGANSYTGDTTVKAGRLYVNGSILGGGDMFVASGARLGGVGSLGGKTFVNRGGTIAPGGSIGALTVGDIQFEAGSTYEVELNDGGAGKGVDNDHINATGAATIKGGTVHVTPENGADDGTTYIPDTTYAVLTSAGERRGEFDAVTDDYAFLEFADSYDANNVYLTSSLIGAGTGACPAGLSANQNASCGGVLSVGGGDLHTAVINLSNADAPIALDQLSGEIHASARAALVEDSRFPREAALGRLRVALGAAAADNGAMAERRVNDMFAFWGQGFGSWSDWDGDGNAARFDRSIGGLFLGGDAEIHENVRLGLFGGYGDSSFAARDRNSTGSADNWYLGAYGGARFGGLGLRFGAAYAWHEMEIDRSVEFAGFSDRLSSSYGARTAQVFGEIGYRIDHGDAAFEPFANIAYVHLSTDGYAETGGEAALTGGGQSMETTFTTIGLRAETRFSLEGTTGRLSGGAGWRHAFGDVTPLATHALAGGDPFTVAGAPIAKDAFVLDLGASVDLTENARLGVAYDGQFGDGFADHGFKVNLSVQF